MARWGEADPVLIIIDELVNRLEGLALAGPDRANAVHLLGVVIRIQRSGGFDGPARLMRGIDGHMAFMPVDSPRLEVLAGQFLPLFLSIDHLPGAPRDDLVRFESAAVRTL